MTSGCWRYIFLVKSLHVSCRAWQRDRLSNIIGCANVRCFPGLQYLQRLQDQRATGNAGERASILAQIGLVTGNDRGTWEVGQG